MFSKRAKNRIKKDLKVQEKQNLEMRDRLAMERTTLANERTFLSYVRSAFAMVIAGLTFIKLFWDDPLYVWIGVAFVPGGLLVGLWGYHRFYKKRDEVAEHTSTYKPTSPVHAVVAEQETEEAAAALAPDRPGK